MVLKQRLKQVQRRVRVRDHLHRRIVRQRQEVSTETTLGWGPEWEATYSRVLLSQMLQNRVQGLDEQWIDGTSRESRPKGLVAQLAGRSLRRSDRWIEGVLLRVSKQSMQVLERRRASLESRQRLC